MSFSKSGARQPKQQTEPRWCIHEYPQYRADTEAAQDRGFGCCGLYGQLRVRSRTQNCLTDENGSGDESDPRDGNGSRDESDPDGNGSIRSFRLTWPTNIARAGPPFKVASSTTRETPCNRVTNSSRRS